MQLVKKTIRVTLGKRDPETHAPQNTSHKEVEALCYKGLAIHPHATVEDGWSVTHIHSGLKIEKSDDGLDSKEDARAFLEFCLMFDVPWEEDLSSYITLDYMPVYDSSLHQFALRREKWKPPKRKKRKRRPEPPPEEDDEVSIFDLF